MKTMKKRLKVSLILLLAVIAVAGVLLYIGILNQDELEESPEPSSVASEEVSDPDEAAEQKDGEAQSEPVEEEDLQVKVGESEYPVIFEDGNYKNLDKGKLIWTVNNLFESSHNFEIIEDGNSYKFYIDGREVESKLYIEEPDRRFGPDIRGSYFHIIEAEGVHHLVWSREFIEAFIEASSKYGEITDELNDFIDRLNRLRPTDYDNLTEAEINSMWYIDRRWLEDEDVGVEYKRNALKQYSGKAHLLSTNVFWIEELPEEAFEHLREEWKSILMGQAIRYQRKDNLPSWIPNDKVILELPPPIEFLYPLTTRSRCRTLYLGTC